MLQRYRDGIVPARPSVAGARTTSFAALPAATRERILDLRLREALEGVWDLVTYLNRTIDDRKPWVLFKEDRHEELDALLYELWEGLRWLAILLYPFMPERMGQMWEQLGVPGTIDEDWASSLQSWGSLPGRMQTRLSAPLFPKIELLAPT